MLGYQESETTMTYRFPIRTGDRVALAPHLDLWAAGVRFGEVEDIQTNEENERRYLVVCNERTSFWTTASDLLGAVGPMPKQPVAALRSLREFIEDFG